MLAVHEGLPKIAFSTAPQPLQVFITLYIDDYKILTACLFTVRILRKTKSPPMKLMM